MLNTFISKNNMESIRPKLTDMANLVLKIIYTCMIFNIHPTKYIFKNAGVKCISKVHILEEILLFSLSKEYRHIRYISQSV